jgi:hypothetical protein
MKIVELVDETSGARARIANHGSDDLRCERLLREGSPTRIRTAIPMLLAYGYGKGAAAEMEICRRILSTNGQSPYDDWMLQRYFSLSGDHDYVVSRLVSRLKEGNGIFLIDAVFWILDDRELVKSICVQEVRGSGSVCGLLIAMKWIMTEFRSRILFEDGIRRCHRIGSSVLELVSHATFAARYQHDYAFARKIAKKAMRSAECAYEVRAVVDFFLGFGCGQKILQELGRKGIALANEETYGECRDAGYFAAKLLGDRPLSVRFFRKSLELAAGNPVAEHLIADDIVEGLGDEVWAKEITGRAPETDYVDAGDRTRIRLSE